MRLEQSLDGRIATPRPRWGRSRHGHVRPRGPPAGLEQVGAANSWSTYGRSSRGALWIDHAHSHGCPCLLARSLRSSLLLGGGWTVASLGLPLVPVPHGDYMTVAVSWFLSAGRRWPTTKSGGGVLKATTRPMSGMEPWHALRFLPFGFWSAKRRPCRPANGKKSNPLPLIFKSNNFDIHSTSNQK
jgi:hypothetical protein